MQLNRNLFLMIFLVGGVLSAQISFKTVPDKTTAKVGERIQLSFIITTSQDLEFDQITFPSFSGFQMLGRNIGQNFSYTNGRMTKQYMETVVLMPQKQGKFTINGGFVMVDGKKYQSNPVILTITKAAPKTSSQNNQLVFMEVVLDKNKVYPNENINAEIKLYARSFDALRRRTDLEVPGMSDFQVREISQNQDRDFEQERINNQVYISESIAQYQLTPTSTGELVIPAFSLRVAIPLDLFDEKVIEVKTNHRTIQVDEFPANAPSNFMGAVGDFRLVTHLDKEECNINESINYEIELIGEGNFSSIILPKMEIPTDLEVYPPKTRNSFKLTSSGEKGKLVDRYTIVPQYGGVFEIPSVEFCYFNPSSSEYITLVTDKEVLQVNGLSKNELLASNSSKPSTDSIYSKKGEEENSIIPALPQKITKIFNKPEVSAAEDSKKWKIEWWHGGLGIPILAGLLWFFVFRNKDKKALSTKGNELGKSNFKILFKEDLQELKTAEQSGNRSVFLKKYQEILNTLVIAHSNESMQYDLKEGSNILSEKISPDFATRWETLNKQIQTMSYGIADAQMDYQQKYKELEDLIKESLNK